MWSSELWSQQLGSRKNLSYPRQPFKRIGRVLDQFTGYDQIWTEGRQNTF